MQYPFDPIHADIESQVLGLPTGIPDSDAVHQARQEASSPEGFAALGQALSRQLRYREAIEAYTAGLKLEPENLSLLRLRAGRYLTTLQPDLALRDFEACLSLGAEKLDCLYRMGLAHYYAGRYSMAMECFEACSPLCDDEMGIAVIYWHTLSSTRAGKDCSLLRRYHTGMAVGHHTAYEMAMSVWGKSEDAQAVFHRLEREPDDLEWGITMYGLCRHPDCVCRESLLKRILHRNGFWPSFAYLAAWNDTHPSNAN